MTRSPRGVLRPLVFASGFCGLVFEVLWTRLISNVVGDLGTAGGHGKMAGGQVELTPQAKDPAEEIRRRLKVALGLDAGVAGKPLIRDGKAS